MLQQYERQWSRCVLSLVDLDDWCCCGIVPGNGLLLVGSTPPIRYSLPVYQGTGPQYAPYPPSPIRIFNYCLLRNSASSFHWLSCSIVTVRLFVVPHR